MPSDALTISRALAHDVAIAVETSLKQVPDHETGGLIVPLNRWHPPSENANLMAPVDLLLIHTLGACFSFSPVRESEKSRQNPSGKMIERDPIACPAVRRRRGIVRNGDCIEPHGAAQYRAGV